MLSNTERMDNIIANLSPNPRNNVANSPDNIFEHDLLATDIVYKTSKIDGKNNATEAMM